MSKLQTNSNQQNKNLKLEDGRESTYDIKLTTYD